MQGFKNKVRYIFSIVLKERNELIGEIGLHLDKNSRLAEMGYWVGEPFWNKGIATEAIAVVLKFGFEQLSLEKIFASCDADNKGSSKVLMKNGMIVNNVNGRIEQYCIKRQ